MGQRLREARSCYDHLAGQLGVALTERLIERRAIAPAGDDFALTAGGETFFRDLGIAVDRARERKRTFARSCLDWTERRPHLAGSLGAAVLEHFLSAGWLMRNPHDRALRITAAGRAELARNFRIEM